VDGITATRQITALPDPPKVIVLTTFHLDEYVFGALRAGQAGSCSKTSLRPTSSARYDSPPPAMPCCHQIGGYRTMIAASGCNAARRLLRRVSDLPNRCAPPRGCQVSWHAQISRLSARFFDLLHHSARRALVLAQIVWRMKAP
jgi:hypothetical protein